MGMASRACFLFVVRVWGTVATAAAAAAAAAAAV